MPQKPPDPAEKIYEIPAPGYPAKKDIQKVARWWCGGDCDKARKLPPALFNEILAYCIAEEKGQRIVDDEAARELKNK